MKPEKVRLFVKPFCGWCEEASEWLDAHGITYETLDVIEDAAARKEMFALSGQSKSPVIEVNGEILADFDVDELDAWWKKHGFADK